MIEKIASRFDVPVLTRKRIWFAFGVAVVVDGIQISLAAFGWFFVDQILDVVAMILTSAAIGFHMLLLPTFVIELFPIADMLPTWTGCVAAVVVLRKRAQAAQPPPVIDVTSEIVRPPTGQDSGPEPPKLPQRQG